MTPDKGCECAIRFFDLTEIFHGEDTGLGDVVTFQGETADDVKAAFQVSIQGYCEVRGEVPNQPFSSSS